MKKEKLYYRITLAKEGLIPREKGYGKMELKRAKVMTSTAQLIDHDYVNGLDGSPWEYATTHRIRGRLIRSHETKAFTGAPTMSAGSALSAVSGASAP